jgi:hypothetical protein
MKSQPHPGGAMRRRAEIVGYGGDDPKGASRRAFVRHNPGLAEVVAPQQFVILGKLLI